MLGSICEIFIQKLEAHAICSQNSNHKKEGIRRKKEGEIVAGRGAEERRKSTEIKNAI